MNTQPTNLNCPACGAPLEPDGTSTVVRCKFCGNVSLLPSRPEVSRETLDAIRQLAEGGNLAEAIERYRQTHKVDLSEAQAAVNALQAGRMVTVSTLGGRSPEELIRTLKDIQRLIADGKKIEAIKLYREGFGSDLERAKQAVDQIEAGQALSSGASSTVGGPPGQAAKPRRSGACLGASIATAFVLLIVGLVLFFTFRSGTPLFAYSLGGPVTLVSFPSGSGPKLAAEFYNPDKDTRFIGLVDGSSHKLLWQAANLSGEGIADAIASGSDLVYAANGSDLLAYRLSDGTLAWQTEMPDQLNSGADMLLTAGRVITDNADQSIQAYDAETGSLVWSKRLSGGDAGLHLMGTSLVVIDQTGADATYSLVLIDPATGNQQNVITPTCSYNDYTSTLDTDAGLVFDAADNALYLVYDSSYGCVQRIDLTTGKVVWEADSQDDFNFSPDGLQAILTDSTLYFSNGNDLLAVDKSSGQMKVLQNNPDYSLLPVAMTGKDLIVRASRTRGSEQFGLWGVDSSSGDTVWQMNLGDAQPIDPPDVMAGLIDDHDSGFTWKLMSAGLAVLKFQAQPNQISLQIFDPATDNALSSSTIALNSISGDFYDVPAVLGWQDNVVYLNLDAKICSLDLNTGKLTVIY
jgi:outer membrane protein assembly factor BamB/ribosomal protein L7/L12